MSSTTMTTPTSSPAMTRFLPIPREYAFEIIIYILEKGPAGMLLLNLIPTYLIFSLVPLMNSSYLNFVFIYAFIPFAIVIGFVLNMWISAQRDSAEQWESPSGNKMPNWKNPKATGVVFNNKALLSQYANRKIPMETAVELYLNGDIDFIDTKQVMLNRYDLFTFVFTWGHVQWFLFTFLGQLTGHTLQRDAREVGDVYNRGNDFYGFFLGKTMVYTSGIFHKAGYDEESLEDAQYRKLSTILDSVQLKPGDRHLDIGCGWGTLVIEGAKRGAQSTGCTLAKEQVAFAKQAAEKANVTKNTSWIIDDYRNIPKVNGGIKYDCITCVEMAEHVGIKNFQPFLRQIQSMLKDDGMLYIQMCGVRRTWSWEDLVWILFMGKYIFPGADASTPINFVVQQLERAGFEIHRMENCGCHYARTIEMWHDNWQANKEAVIKSYNQWWYRLWDVFLSWSTMIARQGTSAVYMITCHKNLIMDEHSVALQDQKLPVLNRTDKFIGDKPIAYQQ